MTPTTGTGDFTESLGCLIAPALRDLAARLDSVTGLRAGERAIIVQATCDTLYRVLTSKLSRLLLLELNAARVNGQLQGADGAARWTCFTALSGRKEFWESLSSHYPTLLQRVERITANRCMASFTLASHFVDDRSALDELNDGPLGELTSLSFGAGDSHRGGRTVVLVQCKHGRVVYKPRSVTVDDELRRFVHGLRQWADLHIQVPRVIDRGDYGWAQFVTHRYATDAEELSHFYRGIGQWLAIMRLLGGSDLHAENLIAQGPRPVVVDCETLFTPRPKPALSGMGLAFDRAVELVSGTVMNMGLLPGRSGSLGWRGIDTSGVGALPGQQPMMAQPAIINAGTDEARLGTVMVEAPIAQNHPSMSPALADHWPEVLRGFDVLTGALCQLDAAGELPRMLDVFADCRIRVVTRATEIYAEVARMLWHPVSLHKPVEARKRAHDLLSRMAENRLIAPDDDQVIEAEIADLLEGDVPFFTTLAGHGELEGPRGTHWLPPANLVDVALQHWRNADFSLERQVIQAALISAYANEGWVPAGVSLRPSQPQTRNLDTRRRQQAALIMQKLVSSCISGGDGSVAWIASVLGPTGRTVQPLSQDLYGGISGIAVLVAAYLHETKAGRADAVAGLSELLPALIRSMALAQEQLFSRRLKVRKARPPTSGGYIGLGSQIWAWLALDHWGVTGSRGLEHACALAELMPVAASADEFADILTGNAGGIVPLIMLARTSGQQRYLNMAMELGDRLCESAQHNGELAYWTHSRWPGGMGGFAHGVTGIGWALAKLAGACGEARFSRVSTAAMAFEDALFDSQEQNWLDLRVAGGTKASSVAWCHGAVGIGLALADLNPGLLDERVRNRFRSAVQTTWRRGLGMNHGVCHGDLGAWELLEFSIREGLGPEELSREGLLAYIVTSLEQHGPVCGMASEAFSPGLMSGLGGVAYQLLRAHPASELPSVMILGEDQLISGARLTPTHAKAAAEV